MLGNYDPRPVQPDSLFPVFSVTKAITAGMLHWLVDNGCVIEFYECQSFIFSNDMIVKVLSFQMIQIIFVYFYITINWNPFLGLTNIYTLVMRKCYACPYKKNSKRFIFYLYLQVLTVQAIPYIKGIYYNFDLY